MSYVYYIIYKSQNLTHLNLIAYTMINDGNFGFVSVSF